MKLLLLIATIILFASCAGTNVKLQNGPCNNETQQCRNSRTGLNR